MKLPQTLIIESANIEQGFVKALSLAKSNLCLDTEGDEGCDNCQSCVSFENSNHPDFILVEKPEDKKNISVDFVREKIIQKINSKPLVSKVCVVIIKNAQTLSIGAQNALLKTLEEPPSYVRIILTVDNASHLLDTIQSRSQILKINQVGDETVSDRALIMGIVNLDLPQRFQLVKEVTDKDKKEERKDAFYTLEFIDKIIGGIRAILKMNLGNEILRKTAVKDLNKVLADRVKILYNTNKLLVLENLMLQTLDKEVYKNCKS